MADDDADSISTAARSLIQSIGDDREAFNAYLNNLIQANVVVDRAISRTAASMLLSAFLFEVFSWSGVKEAEFLAVKLSDLSLVRIAIPVVIVGLMVRLASLANADALQRRLIDELVRLRFPGTWTAACYGVLIPYSGLLIGQADPAFWRRSRFRQVIESGEAVAIVVVPQAFLIYAFWRLYESDLSTTLVSISLALCGLLLAIAVKVLSFSMIPVRGGD